MRTLVRAQCAQWTVATERQSDEVREQRCAEREGLGAQRAVGHQSKHAQPAVGDAHVQVDAVLLKLVLEEESLKSETTKNKKVNINNII